MITSDSYQAVKEAVRTTRGKAQEKFQLCRERLHVHHAGHREALINHFKGMNSGVPGWQATWTRNQFDVAHLHHSMTLSREVREAEEAYLLALEQAKAWRLSPLPDQDAMFPDLTDDGASGISRGAAGNPKGSNPIVEKWRKEMPSSPPEPLSEGQGERQPSSSTQIPSRMHPWESMSAKGSPQSRRRINEANANVRPRSSSPEES